jgi:long-chain acyl-CoA synthetase
METERLYLKSNIELESFEENIGSMIISRFGRFSGKLAVQEKEGELYLNTTWQEIFSKIKQIGLGLIEFGIKKGDRIAILSRDCSEIVAFELACMSIGCVYMPFFLGYYPKQIEYVISHADPKYVVVSDEFQLGKILSTMATGRIEKYFLMDYTEKYTESSRIVDFKQVYKESDDYSPFFNRVSEVYPDDICLLIYTSGGTTGISKGVELTHRNVLGQQKALNQVLEINENDIILSYYPWHQSLGIVEKFAALYSGACLTLDRTPGLNVDSLPDFLNITTPTIFFGSAKIFNELIYEIKKNKKLENAFFHKNVNFAFSSSSPTKEVINYFKSKNVPLLQGWGLTETLQYVTVNSQKDNWESNTSGYPLPGVELQLAGDDREIWVKGINVMKGYYKDKERTEQTISEGWLKTGDSGVITDNGLKILGRMDSIIYLSDTSKVYPDHIEQIVENSSIYISHCVIFGENKPFIVALIFPAANPLMSWYARNNGYSIPLIDALDEKEVIDLYREKIQLVNEMNLEPENTIKYFTLVENELTVKKGELTSGMTVVRKQVFENYKYLTEAFYLEEGYFPELKSRIIEV